MADQVYCIYSGKYITLNESSVEHIIPMSLGGSNMLTILVERKANSVAGSNIDGKITNDPLIKLNIIKKNYRGHSRKEPRLDLKKSSLNSKPITVTFKKSGLELYDPREKKTIESSERIKTEFKLDLEIRIKYVSKVALAAGYFVYGENFIDYADHDILRRIVFSDELKSEELDGILFYDNLNRVKEKDKEQVKLMKVLMQFLKGSSVIFTPAENRIIAHVGIGGQYIGSVNFQADSEKFPNDADNRLGRVLVCRDGKLYEESFWDSIYRMNETLKIVEVDESQIDR